MSSILPEWNKVAGVGEQMLDLAVKGAGSLAGRMLEGNIRLGVTGLRRAGKTVFVTSLIDNLLRGGRLPFMDVVAGNRFLAARLRTSPHREVTRFSFEKYLAALNDTPPHWPAATGEVSQLRLAVRYVPTSGLRRSLQPIATLNLDIFDYPGEWLMDLPMLNQSYRDWSALTLELAEQQPRRALATRWLHWLDTVRPGQVSDEGLAREGATHYTDYLHACRRSQANLSMVQPGRFLEPGSMADSPLLWFCPLPSIDGDHPENSFWGLMAQRYEDYKNNVVKTFFEDHFSRLDRQIVLVDVLGMLNAGPAALLDVRMALTACLEAFHHGRNGWFSRLIGGRIDRVLFAATKADHIAAGQHANLRNLLEMLVSEARNAIRFEGATVETMALAAVKCTETVTTEHQGRKLACIQGTPLGRQRPTVLFPGSIPDGPDLFPDNVPHPYRFLDFEPPAGAGRDGRGLPNIRLDQALNFLLGDHLA
ncbi:MAG: YcjX family protein [Rhodospirillaceae bacterium]